LVGNVSEWVDSDKGQGPKLNVGGSFALPKEKCLEPSKLIDFSTGKGARNIGFRVVDDIE